MLKLLGNIILIVSVTIGALAAATAYHVPLDAPDSAFEQEGEKLLTVKSPSGILIFRKERRFPREPGQLEPTRQCAISEHLQTHIPPLPSVSFGWQMYWGVVRTAIKGNYKKYEEGEDIYPLGPELYAQQIQALSRLKPAQMHKLKVDDETGLVTTPDGLPVALADSGDPLTPELLAELRKQAESDDPRIKQHYVVVREFSPTRWPGLFYFMGSVVGLLLGAFLVQAGSKPKEEEDEHETTGPEATLVSLHAKLSALYNELTGVGRGEEIIDSPDVDEVTPEDEPLPTPLARMAGETVPTPTEANATDLKRSDVAKDPAVGDKLKLILTRLEDAQKSEVVTFVEGRTDFIRQYGLGSYAEVMDRFAACERQINRSWAAAADGVYDESLDCLDAAIGLLEETQDRLWAVLKEG